MKFQMTHEDQAANRRSRSISPRPFVTLACVAILVGITGFINHQVGAGKLTHPAASTQATIRESDRDIADMLQFTSGGQVLGFAADGIYVAGGSHALRVGFVNAGETKPFSDGASD